MIKIRNLKKSYGNSLVLSIDILEINENSVVSIVGNNGAGKTTFLKILVDLLKPSDGEVLFYDDNVKMVLEPQKVVSAYLDETFLLDFLTIREYWEFVLTVNSIPRDLLDEKLQDFKDFISSEALTGNKQIRELSSGNKNKVGIVAAFLTNKDIVILDEPFANLDPKSQYFLTCYFERIKAEHQKKLILSSHNLENIERFSTRIIVIEQGKIINDAIAKPSLVNDIKKLLQTSE